MACKKKDAQYYYENFKDFSVKIPWDCFVRILTEMLEFEKTNQRGSSRLFEKDDIKFTAHEPHGRGDKYVHKDDRRRAIIEIKKLGIL